MSVNLNPEKALIFRIVHVDNVPWILDHDGLHSRNWPEQNPNYINIGNPEVERLDQIDWPLLRSRNFKTDDMDPGKQLRYQAEALVHRHAPVAALQGIGCSDEAVRDHLTGWLSERGLKIPVKTTPSWYF